MVLEILKQFDPLLYALILCVTPVFELRAGIPVAIAAGYGAWFAFLVCSLVNLIAIPICYIFLETFHKIFYRVPLYRRLFDKYVEKLRRRSHKYMEKWGDYAIILFVALPIPGSGAYTGVLLSWLLGIKKRHMFLAVMIGVFIAGAIVTILSASIINGFR
ncbi:small multi-drug export protein [Candidatus Woesearchaeota archaeon]|nr:small multi-drug export protein [Candidatus Woesearchaeota archaeon]